MPKPRESTERRNACSHSQVQGNIMKAAFTLIRRNGWASFHLADLLESGDFSLDLIRSTLASKEDVITLFHVYLSHHLLQEQFAFSPETRSQEKLFEIFMKRFDLMMPYREALDEIQNAYLSSPSSRISGLGLLKEGAKDILFFANIPSSFSNSLAVTVIYGLVIQTWSQDTTSDLSKTMAHLDQLLEKFQQTFNL